MEQLKKQQENVVRPLINEVAKRDDEITKLKNEILDRTKSVKIMFAMMRSPKMCEMFQKNDRNRYDEEKLKELRQNAIHTLRANDFDSANPNEFVRNIYRNVIG